MDLPAPAILPPRVRVLSTPSFYHIPIVKFVLYLSCEEDKYKQKEAGFCPLKSCTYRVQSLFDGMIVFINKESFRSPPAGTSIFLIQLFQRTPDEKTFYKMCQSPVSFCLFTFSSHSNSNDKFII